MKLISLLPINIREAEEEEKSADNEGGEEKNPFAGSEDGGGEEGEEDGAEDAGAESDTEGGDEEKGDATSTDTAKSLEVVFNPSGVRKYNDVKFQDNKGTVTAVSRFGLTVKLPDEQQIFVNFSDIL